jgi:hypothetical protein
MDGLKVLDPEWPIKEADVWRSRAVISSFSSFDRSRASRAWAAHLPPGDKRLFSEAQLPEPARPSVMSQHLKSRTRQARGPTATALPSSTTWFFHPSTSTHNMHSGTVILSRQHCGPIVTISQPDDAGLKPAHQPLKTCPAPDPGAGVGLSGAPPTETGPIGLGSRETFLVDNGSFARLPPKIGLDHGLIGLMPGYRLSLLACAASL